MSATLSMLPRIGVMVFRPAGLVKQAMASYWMSFEFAHDPRATQDDKTLARGAFHVIALAAPYLEPRERQLFDELAKRYIV